MAISSDKNKNKNRKHSGDQSITSNPTSSPNKTTLVETLNKNQQVEIAVKIVSDKTDSNLLKAQTPLNIENEIAKIKISISY